MSVPSCCERTQTWVQQNYFLTALYCTVTAIALYFLATSHIPNSSKLIVGVVLAGAHIGLVIYFLIPPPPPKGPDIKKILLKQGYEEINVDGRICYQKSSLSSLTYIQSEVAAAAAAQVKAREDELVKDLPEGTTYSVDSKCIAPPNSQDFRIVIIATVRIVDEKWLIDEGFQKGCFGKFTKVYPDDEEIDDFTSNIKIVEQVGRRVTVRLLN